MSIVYDAHQHFDTHVALDALKPDGVNIFVELEAAVLGTVSQVLLQLRVVALW